MKNQGEEPMEQDESVLNPEKCHESDLSKKERRLLERQKLAGMGMGKKLEYIWMYYKAAIFGIVLLIAAVFAGWDIYQNAQIKDILNIYVVNGAAVDTAAWAREALTVLDGDPKDSSVIVNNNLGTNAEGTAFNYTSQMLFTTQMQVGTLDVLLMGEPLYEELSKEGLFENLEELLGEQAQAFGDCLKEDGLLLDGVTAGKDISLGYEPVYAAVPVTSQNKENAAKWLESLR